MFSSLSFRKLNRENLRFLEPAVVNAIYELFQFIYLNSSLGRLALDHASAVAAESKCLVNEGYVVFLRNYLKCDMQSWQLGEFKCISNHEY